MGEVRFGVNDVVNVRFAVSPLWETLSSLRAMADAGSHAVHLPWIKTARRLASDPAVAARLAPLQAVIGRPGGPPAFLLPPSNCPLAEIEQELAVVLATPVSQIRAGERAERPERMVQDLAEAVMCWWRVAIQPEWSRIRAVIEADISFRSRQLAEDGIQQLFNSLHPNLRWTGDRLVTEGIGEVDVDLNGHGLALTPSVFARRCAVLTGHVAAPAAFGAIYPARAVGTLWERRATADNGLDRLLGRSRAVLLAYASSPTTTSQLAARTGLSLGAVSQHLAILRDAGLVTSHRYRREVNYTASDLGMALLSRT